MNSLDSVQRNDKDEVRSVALTALIGACGLLEPPISAGQPTYATVVQDQTQSDILRAVAASIQAVTFQSWT